MKHTICPTDEELLAFDAGELVEPVLLAIGAHLENCPTCERKARRFDEEEGDPVAAALRRPDASTAPEPLAAETLIAAPAVFGDDDAWPGPPGYELLEVLGRGGMGVVYKARQIELKRSVALKRVRSFAGSARFRAEAEAVAQLQHPNIVEIFEIGEQAGQPFLVLEYIESGSLERLLNDGPQPIPESAALVETLANAVHYAHSKGIVHRDLKPANVLMASRGREPSGDSDARESSGTSMLPAGLRPPLAHASPKITDFGIAKRLETESSLTHEGDAIGTPSYMAPEQAEGRNADIGTPADIYALGAILYELLTGRPPFREETALATLEAVRSAEPVPPSRFNPGTPRDLEAICLKCLEKSPKRRYSSAAALAEELGRFLSNEPVSARPISRHERLLRWCKRKPFQAALVATVVIAVVAVTSVSALAYSTVLQKNSELTDANIKERSERLRAERNFIRAERNFKRAEGNFGKARKAVHDLLSHYGKTVSFAPHMSYMRQHLIERALEFHQEFLKESSDDPWVRFDAARAYAAVGELYSDLGRTDDSVQSFGHAIRLLKQTPPSPETDEERQVQLANCHLELAMLYKNTQRPDAAKQNLQQSHQLWQQLLQRNPENAKARVGLVRTWGTRARLLSRTGSLEEARRACIEARKALERWPIDSDRDQTLMAVDVQLQTATILGGLGQNTEAINILRLARDTLEPLVKIHGSPPTPRRLLGRVLFNLGNLSLATAKLDEAQTALARSQELREKLHEQFPLPQFAQELARCYDRSASLLTARRDFGPAEKLYRKAIALSEDLHRKHPSMATYRYDTAVQQMGLAVQRTRQNRPQEAKTGFHRAIELLEPLVKAEPNRSNYRLQLGVALGNLGIVLRHEAAMAEARPLQRRAVDHLWKAYKLRPIRSFRTRLRIHHLSWADTLAELDQHDQALKASDRLIALKRLSALGIVAAARFAARWSKRVAQTSLPAERKAELKTAYSDKAMQYLKSAIAHGLANPRYIAEDKFLVPLHGRDDFQKLLKELGVKPKPGPSAPRKGHEKPR